jgi:hypothetical protein
MEKLNLEAPQPTGLLRSVVSVAHTREPEAMPRVGFVAIVLVLSLAGCSKASSGSAPPAVAASAQPIQVGALCKPNDIAFDPKKIDLTGAWADDDQGVYYLRQYENTLWWNGMAQRSEPAAQLGRQWSNVARGTIDVNALSIDMEWMDVPRGGMLSHGTLQLRIAADPDGHIQLVVVNQTGDFGSRIFTPCSPG